MIGLLPAKVLGRDRACICISCTHLRWVAAKELGYSRQQTPTYVNAHIRTQARLSNTCKLNLEKVLVLRNLEDSELCR